MDSLRKRKNLIFWRIENGLKQVDVSKRLGISNGYYSNLEKGRAHPSFFTLIKFKETFDISDVIELFKLDEGTDISGDCNTSGDIEEK